MLDEVDADGVLGGDGIGEVIYFVLEGQTYHTFEKIIGSKVNDYIVNLTPWDHFMEILVAMETTKSLVHMVMKCYLVV